MVDRIKVAHETTTIEQGCASIGTDYSGALVDRTSSTRPPDVLGECVLFPTTQQLMLFVGSGDAAYRSGIDNHRRDK